MTSNEEIGFVVDQIDHVELMVPDVSSAATWYGRVLGLEPVAELPWTEPIMLSSDGGNTKIALFQGTPQEGNVGWRRVAFRVSGADFLGFLRRLDDVPVTSPSGSTVSGSDIVDHDVAFSLYFADPYGNRLEITTYDHDDVRRTITS